MWLAVKEEEKQLLKKEKPLEKEKSIKREKPVNRINQKEDAYNITVKLFVNNANSISSSWML